jgi:hypothetical protein
MWILKLIDVMSGCEHSNVLPEDNREASAVLAWAMMRRCVSGEWQWWYNNNTDVFNGGRVGALVRQQHSRADEQMRE